MDAPLISAVPQLGVYHLGQQPYEPIWQAMRNYSQHRDKDTADELWFLEHPPVFTQGQAGLAEHLLAPGDIPVVQTDRGGQVTYHGPGQLVCYVLVDLERMGLGVRALVSIIEQAIVNALAHWSVASAPRPDAPGIYIEGCKIASLGLRVRRGCSYHGLALNLSMDLSPFERINPCGYAGMNMTRLADQVQDGEFSSEEVAAILQLQLIKGLGYEKHYHVASGQLPVALQK